MPPRKINAAITAITMPTKIGFTPKAFSKELPIEFDCTIFPINPKARIMATEKNPARNFPNFPLKIYLI